MIVRDMCMCVYVGHFNSMPYFLLCVQSDGLLLLVVERLHIHRHLRQLLKTHIQHYLVHQSSELPRITLLGFTLLNNWNFQVFIHTYILGYMQLQLDIRFRVRESSNKELNGWEESHRFGHLGHGSVHPPHHHVDFLLSFIAGSNCQHT